MLLICKIKWRQPWLEEAEERIGELEDKIMEKEEAEKKRDKKRSMRPKLEN